jgi:hypothetical protein
MSERRIVGKPPHCEMVGEAGFEPATLGSQNRCATRLRYSPLSLRTTRQSPRRAWRDSTALLSLSQIRGPTDIRRSHFTNFIV